MMGDEIQELLSTLPLNTVVDLDGDRVYLNVDGSGAELGVQLAEKASCEETRTALQNGFASAMEFNAGLAYMPGGAGLALTRWLSGVSSWISARAALEDLLNQLAVWREWLSPPKPMRAPQLTSRDEKKMRAMLLARRS